LIKTGKFIKLIFYIAVKTAPVAQLDRASDYGLGRLHESDLPAPISLQIANKQLTNLEKRREITT